MNTDNRWPGLKKAFNNALDYDWCFHHTKDADYVITALDPTGWEPILAKTDIKFIAKHICKIHNDWLNLKTKGETK